MAEGSKPISLEGARILVIDDHVDLVDNLQEILEDEGATVLTAATASEGTQVAKQGYDVALVDVRLPDARGLTLVPGLKQDGHEEILLVTGHASIQDAIEAVRAGAFAFVLKPFDSADLITTVERALEQVLLRRRAAKLQARLEQNEAALRTLVDTVQALLLVLDENCVVQLANPAVAAALGVPLDEILGRDWVDSFVVPRDKEQARRACTAIRDVASGASMQTSLMQRDGDRVEERVVSWRLAGLPVDDGFAIYASGLDVTDLRDLERRTQLAEKLAAVGTVSAGLAHEIRNPLNAAGLQLQLLERRLAKASDDPKLREPISTVREEIDRLSRLVTEFLSFARPQALNVGSVDLDRVLRHIVDLEAPVAKQHGVALRYQSPGRPTTIEADAERLRQVVLNLVRNALDAASTETHDDEAPHVDVTLEPDGAGACITVRDNGPGIDEQHVSRIFEPFFTTKEAGTGLGMAIAHKIIDLHGGTIRVDGHEGATFTISLPSRPPSYQPT